MSAAGDHSTLRRPEHSQTALPFIPVLLIFYNLILPFEGPPGLASESAPQKPDRNTQPHISPAFHTCTSIRIAWRSINKPKKICSPLFTISPPIPIRTFRWLDGATSGPRQPTASRYQACGPRWLGNSCRSMGSKMPSRSRDTVRRSRCALNTMTTAIN